jgi:hypothetical protein
MIGMPAPPAARPRISPKALSQTRRFPPPWSVEELDACFVVRDRNGQALAYVYFEGERNRIFFPRNSRQSQKSRSTIVTLPSRALVNPKLPSSRALPNAA